jgi:amino acid transporter
MLNPSRQVVIALGLTAIVCLALGLATGIGLFGWTLALLLVLYLGVAGIVRRRSHSTRRPA